MFCNHLDAQQQERTQEVYEAIKGAEMAHAKDGMPQWKHCRHAFSTWRAFNYHMLRIPVCNLPAKQGTARDPLAIDGGPRGFT